MKDLNDWDKKDFLNIRDRKWKEDVGLFTSIVIVPMDIGFVQLVKYRFVNWMKEKFSWFDSYYFPDGLHDSGYRCMDFIAFNHNKPIARLSGCSDVLHINGIGGYGEEKNYSSNKVDRVDWSVDCLRKTGYLRLFSNSHQLKAGCALSSFDLIAIKKEAE